MSLATKAQRMRAIAAQSPTLRRLAGKPPLQTAAPPDTGAANGSAWTIGDESLWQIPEHYAGSFPLPPVSYGTVRDFADSRQHMPGLAGANFDMKDLQRCWMIKAILGNVERGSRILEIGAGEPLAAGVLSRLGYDVTVVDPYNGSGNGPREFKIFETGYPDLTFVRDEFPSTAVEGDDFAAVYSISVLEHVPLEQIDAVIAGARELLARKEGLSIHAVDHVVAGWGADAHLEKLRRIVTSSGLQEKVLESSLAALSEDPDTYFVSAESHDRWRGELPYDEYPMRRIVSVNLLGRL